MGKHHNLCDLRVGHTATGVLQQYTHGTLTHPEVLGITLPHLHHLWFTRGFVNIPKLYMANQSEGLCQRLPSQI